MGDDIVLNDVSWPALTAFPLQFNGALFTYSPDDVSINDFDFEWECVDDMGNPCAYLLDDTDSGIVDIHLSALSRQNAFGFTLFMNIYNTKHEQVCSDSIGFHATILSDNDVQNALIVSATPIANRINADDKLRIIADIINKDRFDDRYEHRWFEVDGLLTDADVLLHSQTNHNSLNLVLKSNTLKAGHVYHFRLEVLRYNQANVLTQHGISSIIEIYINAAVSIMDHSLLLSPECPNGEITYDSINDYIDRMNQYRVSVVVDSSATNVPLLYEFSHIQANMLSTPFEDHVQLYIGNNTLRAHVYDDALSVVTTASVQCRVMVTDDTQCIDGLFDDLDLFLTDYDIYLYILQQSHLYLQYLFDYKPSDTQCIQEALSVIATTLDQYSTLDALCQSKLVILLSSVLRLWIDVALSVEWFAYADAVHHLVFAVLDPCLMISFKNIYQMTGSHQSHLSILQVNHRYHLLLYSFTDSLLEWATLTHDKQIYRLLSSSLYIASLSTISNSIPGEQTVIERDSFALFSSTISPYMYRDTRAVSIRNVTVHIPALTDPVYMILSAISINESPECSEQAISIAIIDKNHKNVSHIFSSNRIKLEFKCDPVCDDNQRCISYDPLSGLYHDCDTSINPSTNTIICACTPLRMTTVHLVSNQCAMDDTNTFILSHTEDVFSSKDSDVFNLTFGFVWVIIVIHILFQIYPFFVSKYLTWKSTVVQIMLLLLVVSLFNLITCVTSHLLKVYDTQAADILTALLIMSYNLYFVLYAYIFYAWFCVSHAMSPNIFEWKPIVRIVLAITTIIVTLLSWILYVLTMTNDHSSRFIIAVIWTIIICIISVIFIYYAFSVSYMLFKTFAKNAASQEHAEQYQATARRVSVINTFVTLFFVSQSALSIVYTLHHHRFTVILLIILAVNLLFTILLLVTKRKPLNRVIKTETKRTYTIHSWIKKHFDRERRGSHRRAATEASRSNAMARQSTLDILNKLARRHSTQMSLTLPSFGGKHQLQVTQSFEGPNMMSTTNSSGQLEMDAEDVPDLTIYQCIQHANAYPKFYQYCQKKYCADTLATAVEFIQFQNRYNTQKKHAVKIPRKLEVSEIVKDESLSMRDKILALCKKYVVSGAEFEIGVRQKSAILKAMSKLEELPDDECAVIFDDCVFGIIVSLSDTFIGFQKTSHYEELKVTIFKEERERMVKAQRAAAAIGMARVSRMPTQDALLSSTPNLQAFTSISGSPSPSPMTPPLSPKSVDGLLKPNLFVD
eukprot:20844_1